MTSSLQTKGLLLAVASSLVALALAFAAAKIFQRTTSANGAAALAIPPEGTPANRGYHLYVRNCAHCHGADARGDEGPDLHGLTKSDARIASIITHGVKGKMPKFGAKLADADVQSLIAFVRSLNE